MYNQVELVTGSVGCCRTERIEVGVETLKKAHDHISVQTGNTGECQCVSDTLDALEERDDRLGLGDRQPEPQGGQSWSCIVEAGMLLNLLYFLLRLS